MPIIGNTGTSGSSVALTPTDLFLHYPIGFINGCLIPSSFILIAGQIRASGPPANPATMQMALYSAAGAVATWVPVLFSNTLALGVGSPLAWYNIVWPPTVLPPGTYALSVLSNGTGFTGSVHYTVQANAAAIRSFITAGVFPNPLGGPPALTNQYWSMWAEWKMVGSYSPTAACCCQTL